METELTQLDRYEAEIEALKIYIQEQENKIGNLARRLAEASSKG